MKTLSQREWQCENDKFLKFLDSSLEKQEINRVQHNIALILRGTHLNLIPCLSVSDAGNLYLHWSIDENWAEFLIEPSGVTSYYERLANGISNDQPSDWSKVSLSENELPEVEGTYNVWKTTRKFLGHDYELKVGDKVFYIYSGYGNSINIGIAEILQIDVNVRKRTWGQLAGTFEKNNKIKIKSLTTGKTFWTFSTLVPIEAMNLLKA